MLILFLPHRLLTASFTFSYSLIKTDNVKQLGLTLMCSGYFVGSLFKLWKLRTALVSSEDNCMRHIFTSWGAWSLSVVIEF